MTYEELRELDAWLAEHVFGFVWGHFGYVGKDGLPELRHEPIYLLPPERFAGVRNSTHEFPKDKVAGWGFFGAQPIPHYTTDPTAAMEVLKACYKEDRNSCLASFHNFLMRKDHDATLSELQICLFAKKLFFK